MSHFQCIAGCDVAIDVLQPAFNCPDCGGLIDVVHDESSLTAKSADHWRGLLNERASSSHPAYRSGVWAHHEWVMPGIDIDDVVTLGEGRSPLTPTTALRDDIGVASLAIKHCGQSPSGSFKDLGMTVLVSVAKTIAKRGGDIRALICASTGDTSAALSAYGARAGIPVIVLLPSGKISTAQLIQPVANGARVFALDGDFDACMKVVQEVCARPGMFLANSKNPLRLEGQKTVAFEIARERDWRVPDVVAVPSGNLGNVAALYSGFSLMARLGLTDRVPRLVACQVSAADPLYRAYQGGLETLDPVTAAETRASAIRIGAPVSWPRAQKALRQSEGLVTSIDENELLAVASVADREGFFVCPHTAAALAGVKKAVAAGDVAKDADVVVVSTAHGLKFSGQKTAFHEGGPTGGLAFPHALDSLRNPPVELPAATDAVVDALGDVL